MSQVKVSSIVDTSGGNTVTINGMTPTADSLQGFRNRIINGDMRISQRGTSFVSPTDAYTMDRWEIREDSDGAVTVTQESDAPTGFQKSLKVAVTTADSSLGSTQRFHINQRIEGFNTADLAFGYANAQAVTLSFWVKSSLTGTFGASMANSGSLWSYPFTYTISTANTWEYKTVTVPGATVGTWNTTNSIGIFLRFGLGVGSSYQGTPGSWQNADLISATGAVSVIGTLNATWQITGVQLEAGSVATPFERRPYGTELALCQRYYTLFTQLQADWSSGGAGAVTFNYAFKVSMRATPTVTKVGTWTISTITSQPSIGTITADSFNITTGGQSGNCAYNSGVNALGVVTATAEL